jgi:shikimate dehydrogenase
VSDLAITARARLFGVLGHPVGHSLSPPMQNAALRAMGIEGVYLAFDVPPDRLGEAVKGLQALGAAGANCTIPHKEAVLPLLDEISEEASFIGAVNTIVFRDGRLIGYNTDAAGFLAALRAQDALPERPTAVVLGAGGSARAVASALARSGGNVVLANRTTERAVQTALEINRKLGEQRVSVLALEAHTLWGALSGADMLVNTTSIGMSPHVEAIPPVELGALPDHAVVCDLIYNPLETRLLRAARDRGLRGCNGAGMLAHQGALALEIWTGQPAPVQLMEKIIRQYFLTT